MIAWLSFLIVIDGVVIQNAEPPLSCGEASCFFLLSRIGHDVSWDRLDQEFGTMTDDASFGDLR